MIIKEPETQQDWDIYFKIRFDTLRGEWNQPAGSEHLADDDISLHALAYTDDNEAVGVCRLHFNSPTETQIRMMGVVQNIRAKGAGSALLNYFEEAARSRGATKMVLDARDTAIGFYEKNGYQIVKPTHVLWGLIPHFWMEKDL